MKKFDKYPKYKNSGIAWLGEIPEHWEVRRIKYLFTEMDSRSIEGKEELLSVSQYTGVTKKSDKISEGKLLSNAKSLVGYKVVKNGDLVINIMLAWNGSLGISKYEGIVSPAYCVYRSLIGGEKYFGYLFRTKKAQQEFKKQSTGIIDSRLRLYTDKFFNIKTIIPPKEEQTPIVRFLDFKLTKIDRFISKKKQLIKLLNEKKAAILNQAVTKGLDPNTKMRPSGIDWFGDIPEHWVKYKLKYLVSKPISGQWGQEPNNDPNDIFCIRVADFKNLTIKDYDLTIRNIEVKEVQILKKGDLLIEKSGGGEKTPVGRVVIFSHDFKAVTSNFVSKVSAFDSLILSEYLLFLFKAINNVKWNIRSIKQTTGIQNLDTYEYFDNWLFIPEKFEQDEIISFINNENIKIYEIISTIEKEIALTQEYRTALIAEAVTGKIDVRGYKIPEIQKEIAYEDLEDTSNFQENLAAENISEYQTKEIIN